MFLQILLFTLILLFGTASYAVGLWQMLHGAYAPSVFSRVVWLLLALNSFAAVVLSGGTKPSIVLAAILLAGNAAVCAVSFWKGVRAIGRLEYFCLATLALSGMVWLLYDAPLVNLGMSLVAHFIGALPTYRKVWQDASSESTAFWSLFFVASVLSIAASWGQPLQLMVFPVYYALFDGSMFVLAARHHSASGN